MLGIVQNLPASPNFISENGLRKQKAGNENFGKHPSILSFDEKKMNLPLAIFFMYTHTYTLI